MTAFVVEMVGSWLESAVCLCIVVLQFYSDMEGAQEAMLGLEMSLLGIQVRCTCLGCVMGIVRWGVGALHLEKISIQKCMLRAKQGKGRCQGCAE